ncbi:MAG: hypothetical protein U5K28_12760 [Halobacteriales archaeon]|nr:hypothetical protein [Halobacteriales archaeon]
MESSTDVVYTTEFGRPTLFSLVIGALIEPFVAQLITPVKDLLVKSVADESVVSSAEFRSRFVGVKSRLDWPVSR